MSSLLRWLGPVAFAVGLVTGLVFFLGGTQVVAVIGGLVLAATPGMNIRRTIYALGCYLAGGVLSFTFWNWMMGTLSQQNIVFWLQFTAILFLVAWIFAKVLGAPSRLRTV